MKTSFLMTSFQCSFWYHTCMCNLIGEFYFVSKHLCLKKKKKKKKKKHYPISEMCHDCCWVTLLLLFDSLAPGRFQFDFRKVIFKLTLVNGGWGISYEIALRWMPQEWQDLTDDKSTLVQVMVWCCQATSHYLSQCWPRSMSPNGVTKPQWVNSLRLTVLLRVLLIERQLWCR